MDMQLRQFTNRTIGWMKLSNCITDDIAICINNDMQMQSGDAICLFMFLMICLIFNVLVTFMKTPVVVD